MGDIDRPMSAGERVRFVDIQSLCRSVETPFESIRLGMDRLQQHMKAFKTEETMLKEKKQILPTPVFRFLHHLEARAIQRQRKVQGD
eukprot:3114652-Karenia_brevis.AAC.1